jgi:hypothetical protein
MELSEVHAGPGVASFFVGRILRVFVLIGRYNLGDRFTTRFYARVPRLRNCFSLPVRVLPCSKVVLEAELDKIS